MLTFGKAPSYQDNRNFALGVSDDGKAFTLNFDDFEISLQGAGPPIALRTFSLVLPLEGQGTSAEIEFGLGGFAAILHDATATAIFSVNGQTLVADFAENSEESFVRQLKFAAKSPSECRLSIFLLGGRDTDAADSAAFLRISSVDAELRG